MCVFLVSRDIWNKPDQLWKVEWSYTVTESNDLTPCHHFQLHHCHTQLTHDKKSEQRRIPWGIWSVRRTGTLEFSSNLSVALINSIVWQNLDGHFNMPTVTKSVVIADIWYNVVCLIYGWQCRHIYALTDMTTFFHAFTRTQCASELQKQVLCFKCQRKVHTESAGTIFKNA